MKLIDVEDVCKEIDRFKGYLDEDMIGRLKIAVKRLPIVETISINYIMKYCYEKQEQYSISRAGFWLLWQTEVKKMIENWREENERV